MPELECKKIETDEYLVKKFICPDDMYDVITFTPKRLYLPEIVYNGGAYHISIEGNEQEIDLLIEGLKTAKKIIDMVNTIE